MKRFEFPLEKVLRLREHAETEALSALAVAVRKLRLQEEALARIEGTKADALSRLSQFTRSGSDVDMARLHSLHLEVEQAQVLKCSAEVRIREARTEVLRAEEELRRRRADRLALENLRDQARFEHQKESDREEARVLDETAGTRHQKKSTVSGRSVPN